MYNQFKFYRVYHNQTTVNTISVNDFKFAKPIYMGKVLALLSEAERYVDYTNQVRAMEQAKAGALAYIDCMVNDVALGIAKLITYRNDHYQDLNVDLLEANIRKFKRQMYIK